MIDIESKKIFFRQKQNWNDFLLTHHFQIDADQLLFYPQSSTILQMLELQGNMRIARQRTFDISFFEKFVASFHKNDELYMIFPNVSLGAHFYHTNLPVLKDTQENVVKLLKNLQFTGIDYFAIVNSDFTHFLKADGYCDFPDENNGFYDGVIFDYFSDLNTCLSL